MAKKSETYRAFLLTLPEKRFFRVYRHYLGDFSTPYHRADLASRWETFLQMPETIEALKRQLSPTDRRFLSLLVAYPGWSTHALAKLWDGPEGFEGALRGMEDRLLAYRTREAEHETARPSPAVDPGSWGLGLGVLRAGIPVPPQPPRPPRLSESLLTAVLMFLREFPIPNARKAYAQRTARFHAEAGFDEVLDFLRELKIVGWAEENPKTALIHEENWEYLAGLEPQRRLGLFLGVLAERAEASMALGALAVSLPRDKSWSATTLPHLFWGLAESPAGLQAMADALVRFGVIRETSDGAFQCVLDLNALTSPPPPVKVASTYEITVERADLGLGLLLFRVAALTRFDTVLTCTVNKDAIFRTLARGQTAQNLTQLLEGAGDKPLPQNVAFTLDQWVQEFKSVQIVRGLVILVDEARRKQLEHLGFTSDPEVRTVAGGVYVVPQAAWPRLLEKSSTLGWNSLPIQEGIPAGRQSYWGLRKLPDLGVPVGPWEFIGGESEKSLPAELGAYLDNKPPGDQKDCFLGLWNNGAILHSDQWERAWVQCAPQEALGMNLPGKLRLVQEALDEGNRVLELRFQDEDGKPREVKVLPLSLRKHGPQFFIGYESEGRRFEVSLSRVALLRSLRIGI